MPRDCPGALEYLEAYLRGTGAMPQPIDYVDHFNPNESNS